MQQPVPPNPRPISRRSALAAGSVATLAPLMPIAASATEATLAHAFAQRATLSGRVLGASGHPVRGATVMVGQTRARTDGDGRFFTEADVPTDGPLALKVLPEGGARPLRLLADVERYQAGDRRCASIAVSLAV